MKIRLCLGPTFWISSHFLIFVFTMVTNQSNVQYVTVMAEGGPLSVLRCIVMFCFTGGPAVDIILCDVNNMEWLHIAWKGCLTGKPSEAG